MHETSTFGCRGPLQTNEEIPQPHPIFIRGRKGRPELRGVTVTKGDNRGPGFSDDGVDAFAEKPRGPDIEIQILQPETKMFS